MIDSDLEIFLTLADAGSGEPEAPGLLAAAEAVYTGEFLPLNVRLTDASYPARWVWTTASTGPAGLG